MTSMLWEIPNMTTSDLCSGSVFLSWSASDRGLAGNCYCDGCQVPSCRRALTFCQLWVHKLPTNGQQVYQHKLKIIKKKTQNIQQSRCWHLIPQRKSCLMLVYFLCWTLALAKLQLRPLLYILLLFWVIFHVTINHFTFFCTSAALRPDSLSRQTWCELSKVSLFTCCVWWWWSAACGLPL